jgi:predicted Fe-Mo cluster-binding NifX family protein
MTHTKIMIAIAHDDVAPRFDLAVEAVIAEAENGAVADEPRLLLLSEPSGDEMCALAVRESVDTVICGGIDDVHYEYLAWKKIGVIDGVIGPYQEAIESLLDGRLAAGDVLPGAKAE